MYQKIPRKAHVLVAFRKIAKSDYYLCHVYCPSAVCPSVRMENLCSHWKNSCKILYLNIFKNLFSGYTGRTNRRSTGRKVQRARAQ